MDPTLTTLVRDLGPAGILGVALYFCVRALAPAIQGLIDAQRELAAARKAQADASQAVLKRWEDSDTMAAENRREHVAALELVSKRLEKLDITDSQRIKQNDVMHAVINGMKSAVDALPKTFMDGKDDAVEKVTKAMDEKHTVSVQSFEEVKAQLAAANAKLDEVLAFVHAQKQAAEKAQDTPADNAPKAAGDE